MIEIRNGKLLLNGIPRKMAGVGDFSLIQSYFMRPDDPEWNHKVSLDTLRSLAGDRLTYIRAPFSGTAEDAPAFLDVWLNTPEVYLDGLKTIIDYAASKNILILADLCHAPNYFESRASGSIYDTSSAAYALYKRFVTDIASRFKDNPWIMAWETINEPDNYPAHADFFRDIYQAIRAIDSKHIIFHGFDLGAKFGDIMVPFLQSLDGYCDALCGHMYNEFCYDIYEGYMVKETGIIPHDVRERAWDKFFADMKLASDTLGIPVIDTEIGTVWVEGNKYPLADNTYSTGDDSFHDAELWKLIWGGFIKYDIQGAINSWNWTHVAHPTWIPDSLNSACAIELERAIQTINPTSAPPISLWKALGFWLAILGGAGAAFKLTEKKKERRG